MTSFREQANNALDKMVSGAAASVRSERQAARVAQLPADKVEQLKQRVSEKGRCLQDLPLDLITLDSNVRTQYGEEALVALCASLKNEGLLQFPTVYIRELDGVARLVCSNGHRRIMAAKRLGWARIECVVVPSFKSGQERLYHVLNANMREDVYFLDLAQAYADAHDLGEQDEDIAARIGANPRTVSWYRRLAEMSPVCARLAREYPKLFTATWAIRMARQGPMLPEKQLHMAMQEMVAAGRSWLPSRDAADAAAKRPDESVRQRLSGLREFVSAEIEPEHHSMLQGFVAQLGKAGLVPKKSLKTIEAMLTGKACT